MSTAIARGITVRDCPNGIGRPICVSDSSDDSLNINVFLNDEDRIVGVCVYDPSGDLLTATGLLPREVVDDERRYARRSEITETAFYPAERIWE